MARADRIKSWSRDWSHRAFDPAVVGSRRRLVLTLVVVLALGSAQVWVRLHARALGYQMKRTTSLMEALDHEHSELLAELERERSPERVRQRGMELGLDTPKPGQVLAVKNAKKP